MRVLSDIVKSVSLSLDRKNEIKNARRSLKMKDGVVLYPKRIKELRELQGLTQVKLSNILDVKPSFISRIETQGKICSPSLAEKIFDILNKDENVTSSTNVQSLVIDTDVIKIYNGIFYNPLGKPIIVDMKISAKQLEKTYGIPREKLKRINDILFFSAILYVFFIRKARKNKTNNSDYAVICDKTKFYSTINDDNVYLFIKGQEHQKLRKDIEAILQQLLKYGPEIDYVLLEDIVMPIDDQDELPWVTRANILNNWLEVISSSEGGSVL